MSELMRFVETSLRGKKAALHSNEHSPFAKHLSHHLASWGLDVNHISINHDEENEGPPVWESSSKASRHGIPTHLGRFDSGFGGSDSTSPPHPAGLTSPASTIMPDPIGSFGQAASTPPAARSNAGSEPGSTVASSPPLDPQLNFIIVDDEVSTLKRQLISVRNNMPTVQLHNALLAKRPQLQSRRTRSSQAIQRVTQQNVNIIHFTSLTNYRQIKELVHSILKNASPMFPLPEVLVVPKPVGPRRLLTALFNAVKKPNLDPYFVPIATSPSSPGGHYFYGGGRPSPAPSHTNTNDFDAAAGHAFSQQQRHTDAFSASTSHSTGPKTPPGPGQGGSNPPSPVSPDALEYFSKSAVELGSSASQGIIIQSPDGRPTGLFFQPRAASLHEKAESMRMARAPGDSGSLNHTSSHMKSKNSPALGSVASIVGGTDLPAIMIPENMDISTPSRGFTAATSAEIVPSIIPNIGQRSEALANAKQAEAAVSSNDLLVKGDGESTSSGTSDQPFEVQPSRTDYIARSASEPSSPKSPLSPSGVKQNVRSPTSIASPTLPTSPIFTSKTVTPSPQGLPVLSHPLSPTNKEGAPSASPPARRGDRKGSGRLKKVPRRPTGTLVPPINVLIVEGMYEFLFLISFCISSSSFMISPDNPINQIILSTFLKRKGIKYSVANNGQEAVDSWKDGDFHLVLMDIQLPVKDGIEATQEIRALEHSNNKGYVTTPASEVTNPLASPSISSATSPYELPVIIVALTASSLQSDRVNALAAGCNDFLTKPVSLQWLNQKLVEWGSMAYLSGFSRKRRATLMSPHGSAIQVSTQSSLAMQTPEEKAEAEKAEKEAMKARLKDMMTRRPPGLEKPSAKKSVQATLHEVAEPSLRDEPAASEAMEMGHQKATRIEGRPEGGAQQPEGEIVAE